MATYTQMAGLARKRQVKLKKQIAKAEASIAAWNSEVKQLDGLVSSLEGMGVRRTGGGPRGGARRRGSKWKPGRPGRPPQWYLDQERAKGKRKTAKKPSKRKKKVSAKVLAGLAKAREALAAKRNAKKAASK